jgi:uncharacterized protein
MKCKTEYQLLLNEQALPLQLKKAETYLQRLKGWMFKTSVSNKEALWIEPCNSIHTFFMKFVIDAVFVDRNGKVISCCEYLLPRRGRVMLRSHAVIELHAGMIAQLNIKLNDVLTIKNS